MTRPMVTVGVPFLTFTLVVSFFTQRIIFCIIGLLIILFILSMLFISKKYKVKVLVIIFAALLSCIRWTGYQASHLKLNGLEGKSYQISGIIKDMKPASSKRTAYTIKVKSHNILNAPKTFTAILYANSELDCDLYDTISTTAKCMAMSSTPTFDMKQYYHSQGIDLLFSSYNEIFVDQSGKKPPMYYFKTLNAQLCKKVDYILSEPYAGLVKAILLGNDNTMDEMVYHQFVRSGITHIFVVSGLHVSLIAGLVMLLLKKIGVSSRLCAVITGAAVWGFAALTGLAVPVLRAGVMLSVMLAATVFRRPADTLNSLFLAGVIIILKNPAAILGGSFQLTFTATLGAVLLANPISEWMIIGLHLKNKILKSIVSMIAMTIACNLSMLPVVLILFKGISLVSVLENLIAIPLLPVILTTSVIMLLLYPVPAAAAFCGKFLEILLHIIIKTSEYLGSMKFSYLGLNFRFVTIWLIVTLILIAAALLAAKNRNLAARLCCIMMAGFTFLLCIQKFYSRNIIEIATVESFGAQGVVISCNGVATVVSLSDDNYLDKEVETFLRSKNIRYISNIILGFPSTEHISDMEFLTSFILTNNLILNDTDEFFPYAQDMLPIKGKVYPLKEGKGYYLYQSDQVNFDVQKAFDGVLVMLQAGNTKIAVSNSKSLIENANCEILFCNEKNIKNAEKNSARYVILLDEPQGQTKKFSKQYFAAYRNEISVAIRENGSYVIRG